MKNRSPGKSISANVNGLGFTNVIFCTSCTVCPAGLLTVNIRCALPIPHVLKSLLTISTETNSRQFPMTNPSVAGPLNSTSSAVRLIGSMSSTSNCNIPNCSVSSSLNGNSQLNVISGKPWISDGGTLSCTSAMIIHKFVLPDSSVTLKATICSVSTSAQQNVTYSPNTASSGSQVGFILLTSMVTSPHASKLPSSNDEAFTTENP